MQIPNITDYNFFFQTFQIYVQCIEMHLPERETNG